jgi:indole-3-glycerol phosphate synthase
MPMPSQDDLITKKKTLLQERMHRTSLEAVRAMASMQTRPVPFLTQVGASMALVGQVHYTLPRTGKLDLDLVHDPVRIAKRYYSYQVDALSIYTDSFPDYDGTVDMALVNDAMHPFGVPVISQNYVLHEYDIVEQRAAGASVVTLTAGLMSNDKLRNLASAAHRNRMTAIVDVFNEEQLAEVLTWSPQVIGLSRPTFDGSGVDMAHIKALRAKVTMGQHVMITAPLRTPDELVEAARLGISAVTIDEQMMVAVPRDEITPLRNSTTNSPNTSES